MFEVGKKVVCVKSLRGPNAPKKGDIKEVWAIKKGCKCVPMLLDVGIIVNHAGTQCHKCDTVYNTDKTWWTDASHWAPLSDMQTEISETTVESILEPELENV